MSARTVIIFYPFDDFVQLREVIIGPLCATQKEDIEDALKTYQDTVTITKARLAFRTFRVVENLQGFRSNA